MYPIIEEKRRFHRFHLFAVFSSLPVDIRRDLQFTCETYVQFEDVWIRSDSHASVQHLSNWTSFGDQTSLDILNLLGRISSDHRVHFQWRLMVMRNPIS
ncbi:hypothetical protein TNCV_2535101 [Trichonephila clavipes]|nr:hypothetical protein TNCV_2535101 [Trichonephila clavipes]